MPTKSGVTVCSGFSRHLAGKPACAPLEKAKLCLSFSSSTLRSLNASAKQALRTTLGAGDCSRDGCEISLLAMLGFQPRDSAGAQNKTELRIKFSTLINEGAQSKQASRTQFSTPLCSSVVTNFLTLKVRKANRRRGRSFRLR
jgi:hypothetical protein